MPDPVLNTIVGKRMVWNLMSGDTAGFDIVFKEDDNTTPIDIRGIDFKMQFKKKGSDPVPKAAFGMAVSGGEGFTVTNETNPATHSVINFNNCLSFTGDILLKGIEAGYVFDIQGTKDGITTTYVFGPVVAQQDVTDSENEV